MRAHFERIAIVNRGEPAIRFIRAVRQFNRENKTQLRTIVLYTEPDRHARFIQEADEAINLGEATFFDVRAGQRKPVYVDHDRIARALQDCGADAVWVGWGFVSESPEFADLCTRMGLAFIGPDGESMRLLGDKISAKRLAERVGVQVIPWHSAPADTFETALEHAATLGYPVVVKATAGAGGRGIRKVESESELEIAFHGARNESRRVFGNQSVFVERWMEGARHVEVQILADRLGTTWALGTRDCTMQRRHQKIMEEAPAAILSREQERALREAAVRMCKAAGYRNAGTVEFLFVPETQQHYFMEVNTRLQVEHAVTELTTGLDLVKLQLHIARGGLLEGQPPESRGHALEVRLNAEDAEAGFAPAPGKIELFRVPTQAGLRLDSGVSEADAIPAEFDSMFAKLISHGQTRAEALAGVTQALEESAIIVAGGATNRAFLLQLLEREEVKQDRLDVGWLDRQAAAGGHVSGRHADIALLRAAIDVYDSEFEAEREQFLASALRMRPVVRTEAGRLIELRHRGHLYKFQVFKHSMEHYRIDVDGASFHIEINPGGRFEQWLAYQGTRHRVLSMARGLTYLVEVDGAMHKISRDESGNIRAVAPSVVVSIDVKPGDAVAAGDRLALLEAMKMEMPVVAPFAGTVREVFVLSNAQVGTGAPLIRIDPGTSEMREQASHARIVFGSSAVAKDQPETDLRTTMAELRHLLLGADLHPAEFKKLVDDYVRVSQNLPPYHQELIRCEDEILSIYVDISALFRRQALPEDKEDAGRLSSSEYLHAYLRTLDGRGAGLPQSFLEKLRRALRHYGDDSLEPTPTLKDQLLLIFRSHQNMEQRVPVITAILERRLAHAEILIQRGSQNFPAMLDRLGSVSEGRFPLLSDLAREIKYHYFDLPAFERARSTVYAEMDHHITYLLQHPDAEDRARRVQALVQCHHPLVARLSARFEKAQRETHRLFLEVLTRRFYRIRQLESVHTAEVEGHCLALAEYDHEGKRVHLISMDSALSEIASALKALPPAIAHFPVDHDVVVDAYTWSQDPLGDLDENVARLEAILNGSQLAGSVRRVVVAMTRCIQGKPSGQPQYFTFRLTGERYCEEKPLRGLHPMMSKRLQLWRLQNFSLERLPSVEDIHLFRGVARENAKDERLFVIAEVRDLTPTRDSRGRVVRLPYLERMLMEALAAIRQVQRQRTPEEKLHWNRVLLHIWPPTDLQIEELQSVIRRLARQTEGLGLEKVVLRVDMTDPQTGVTQTRILSFSNPGGRGIVFRLTAPSDQWVRTLSEYDQKVVRMRQRGLTYPFEIIRTLTPKGEAIHEELPPGMFVEYDLDANGKLVPAGRPYGCNTANIVVGLIRNFTKKYPGGMSRVILLGDPSREVGSIAEPECRRIIAALDMAQERHLPLEWFTHSAGAKISMESGTENMDWIARVLRRLIDFTQAECEVNVVVAGINVGAQPYWNAEATMLMHTRGILVMMPESAMVLTGKTALDYSGSVSAEDNLGIGGYERVMGPNGQAQYWARDLAGACQILMRHYDHTYVVPGERFPRRASTGDPAERDVCMSPHASNGEGFALVGDIFSDEHNPGRKKPFEIRKVMLAVVDRDLRPLERWPGMEDAEISVIWDAHIGGYPVCLIGFESRPLTRTGFVATDGPEQWTAGTLFPLASKKTARAINTATNNRPLVILANLSGFDGSPESMRRHQLEFGAEIGRAIVNFKGPIIFCVISRYHGGAFVVFSRVLNENFEAIALEGTYASVIGGAPAAAVVFAREVDKRTRADARIASLEREVSAAADAQKRRLRAKLAELRNVVRSEKLGEVADEFDHIHSVHRALQVGSLDRIIPASQLRPYLIDAIERGMKRELERISAAANAAEAHS
jgi:acetyl/propionyl-CoA carboxylase alpha subunit/acetyl-CoA carboxylase carboxyltransferase component